MLAQVGGKAAVRNRILNMDQSIRCLVRKWTPTPAETRFTLGRAR